MNDIQSKIISVIAEHKAIEPTKVAHDVLLDELGFDDLDKIEVIMKIEEQYMLEISDDDADLMLTVSDIVTYVSQAKNS